MVELIVVLVILAILAAILVPALLGWIDKAKEKQYVLEARSVYMAAQAMASEKYAADPAGVGTTATCTFSDDDIDAALTVADVATTVDTFELKFTGGGGHDNYIIAGMTVIFVDGTVCQMADGSGTWITYPDSTGVPAL